MKIGPLGLALFVLFPVSIATAQPLSWQERRALRYEEERYAYGARGAYEVCPRWCPQDAVPCDPPHFKIADGRCHDRRGNR
jgi:hypothetical protein